METKTADSVDWDEFYSKLGYLYYGIAAATGPVDAETLDLLKKLVNRIWARSGNELPGFQGYMAGKVDSVFDWLNLNDTDWEYCSSAFGYFMNRNRSGIPESLKVFVRSSATEIAAIVAKEDNPVLARIDELIA